MHEPSLWELAQRDRRAEAYRFAWLRARNRPITVRLVVRTSGSGWINRREITGTGAGEPGHIVTYGVSWLTHAKTQSLIAAFAAAEFWSLPTRAGVTDTAAGADSSQWILEAVQNGRYHVVERASPGPNDPVRAIGLMALKLAPVPHAAGGRVLARFANFVAGGAARWGLVSRFRNNWTIAKNKRGHWSTRQSVVKKCSMKAMILKPT